MAYIILYILYPKNLVQLKFLLSQNSALKYNLLFHKIQKYFCDIWSILKSFNLVT